MMRKLGTAGVVAGLMAVLLPAPASAVVQTAGRFTYVTTTADVGAGRQGSKVSRCPSDTVVVGGGVYTTGATLDDEAASTAPWDGGDSDARPDDGWIGEINAGVTGAVITTTAICAPFSNVKYVSKTATVQPQERDGAVVNCPTEEARLLGGGAWTSGRSTKITLGGTVPKGQVPTVDGWRGIANNGTGTPRRVTAYAICKSLPAEDYTHSGLFDAAPPGQSSYQTPCFEPSEPVHVVGGGTRIGGGLQGEINSTIPWTDPSDPDSVRDDGWLSWTNNETGTSQTRETHSYCLT